MRDCRLGLGVHLDRFLARCEHAQEAKTVTPNRVRNQENSDGPFRSKVP